MQSAFLPASPLLPRRPAPRSRSVINACATPPPQPSRLNRLAAAALLSLSLATPFPARARQRQPTIQMTDQVPNFTLPSHSDAQQSSDTPALLVRALALARRTVPPLAAIALVVWAFSKLLRRAQQRQLRDFQTQLQSLSSMLDLDAPASSASPASSADPATAARDMIDSSRRYRFRAEDPPAQNVDDLQAKVQLDLFSGSGASTAASPPAPPAAPPAVEPATAFEETVAECVRKVAARPAEKDACSTLLAEARVEAGLSDAEAKPAFERFVSRFASAYVDRAAAAADGDDQACLAALNDLAGVMTAASVLVDGAKFEYVGDEAEEDALADLYRRYALFCMSSEDGDKSDLQALVDMQALLKVDEKRAEQINAELAKGMFQVAVSAAMADGSLDKESKEALDTLKDSFGQFLDGGSADSIMSEVAVMRAMYSLQQLLQEQGVSEEDVLELRKMCAELGVDIDEMLRNADALGDALGPEAKEFVESLRGLLENTGNGDSGVVTTATKPVNPGKDGTGES